SGCFQRTSPLFLSRHQRKRLSPSATLRKIRSRQMIGVEPLQPGIPTFQTTFSWVVHLTGKFFSLLTPLSAGPRHCGQFCAWATCEHMKKATAARVSFRIHPPGARRRLATKRHKKHKKGIQSDFLPVRPQFKITRLEE